MSRHPLSTCTLAIACLLGACGLGEDAARNCEATKEGIARRAQRPKAEIIDGSWDNAGDRYSSASGCSSGDINWDAVDEAPCFATFEAIEAAGGSFEARQGELTEPTQYMPADGADCAPGDRDLRTE